MDKQQQFPALLSWLKNLPLHNLLSILSYLDQETKILIQQNSTKAQNSNYIFQNLVSLSLFAAKYLASTDRSVYFNFYNQPTFLQYEKDLIGDICVRNSHKYFKIQASLQKIFDQIRQELSCLESIQSIIQIIETNIKDPLIPLPRMRKQGIAVYCNSALQFGLVDLIFQAGQQQDNYVQDCILDLQQFLECIEPSMHQLLGQRIKTKTRGKSISTIMKQIYYHPQILNLHNYQDYIIKSLTTFNLFVYMHVILSGVSQMYHEYVVDQQKQFERFIEYLMRFSIFRSIILSFEQSKISKILYTAVQKLIQKGEEIIKSQEQAILEVNVELQNKRSGQQIQVQQLLIIQNLSRLPSQVKTQISQKSQKSIQLYKNTSIQMSSRLFLACGKIWANQNRRVKQSHQQNSSPMKYQTFISQDSINNKSYVKILNRLLHFSIGSKLQKQIVQISSPTKKIEHSPPVRDEDILDIFGSHHYEQHQIISPTSSHGSIPISVGSLSQSPSSPSSLAMNFSDIMKNADTSCAYENFVRAVQNKFKVQQYRFQKGRQFSENDASSISPQKQKQMPQLSLQNLSKIPSFKQNKLLSRVSMLSKFTKMTEIKAVSSVQDLFQSDISVQQQILTQYHSHLIDMSVNQFSVHWCGHSQQPLMFDYYQQFQDLLLKFSQGFMNYTIKTIQQVASKIVTQQKSFQLQHEEHNFQNISLKLLKKLLEWQLQYLDIGFVSKRTVKKLQKIANDLLKNACKKYNVNLQENDMIKFHNEEVDKMIEHYNETIWKIDRYPPPQKRKIYEQRKSPRNIIQVARQPQNQNIKDKNNLGKKPERKRRNSEQVLVVHNMQ